VNPATVSRTRRVATTLGEDLFGYALAGAGIGVFLLVANIVPNAVWADIEHSMWSGASVVFQYLLVGVGVTVGAGYMPVYVGHGVTRRDFTAGALVALACLAAGAALATTAGFGVERLVYEVADWPHVLDNPDNHIYDRPDQYGAIVVELVGLYLTHILAGLVVISALFRLGWVLAAPVMAAGVAIAVGAEVALASGVGVPIGDWLGLAAPSAGVGLAVTAVLVVIGTGLVAAMLAGVEIESRDAPPWR
jgi:hypothetical protein